MIDASPRSPVFDALLECLLSQQAFADLTLQLFIGLGQADVDIPEL